MPIQLTTPVSTGDLTVNDLTHVKIGTFKVNSNSKRLEFTVRFGYFVDGNWVDGEYQPPDRGIFIILDREGEEDGPFTTMITDSVPNAIDEKLYDGVSRTLYQWLLDNHSDKFAGTIV